ncbi:MAG: TlpA disulfide reductase family protein [Candidatus Nanopelagicales bacterium]
MRAPRHLLVISVATLALIAGCGRDPVALRGSDEVGVTILQPADRVELEPITGEALDGDPLSLIDYRGKVVVLNAWASWCEPCKQETPALVRSAARFNPDDVAFIGLDAFDSKDAAADFVKQYSMSYPSLFDPEGSVLGSLPGIPPKAVPSTLILDRDGRIAVRIIGPVPTGLDALIASVVDPAPAPSS